MTIPHPSEYFNFNNRIVLVTGAAKGIGAGIASRFGETGASLAIHCNTNLEQAKEVAETMKTQGCRVMVIQADITLPEEIDSMFNSIEREMGAVDVVVNNAGIYSTQNLLEMSAEEWDKTLNSNLKSVFLCTQASARQMMRHKKGGSIVNISSIEAINPAHGHCHYSASKAGVEMFTMNAALELGPFDIRVNSVAPGLINSPQLTNTWKEGKERWLKRVPLSRLGEPMDIADACLFFASDASRWITGSKLIVDGGMLTNQIF